MSTSVLASTNIATTVPKPANIHVYYQESNGDIIEKFYNKGWSPGSKLPIKAAPATPLAAVNLTVGEEEWLRVYYLSVDHKIKEACYVSTRGWYDGGLNAQNVQAAAHSSLAAFTFDDAGQTSIRVYYQEADSNKLQEHCYTNEKWFRGATNLPVALSGTGLAAIAYFFHGQQQHRLYYQAEDLHIREHAFVGTSWHAGEFDGGANPSQCPLGALYASGRGVVLDVYWMDSKQQIVHSVQVNSVWANGHVTQQSLKSGAKFAVGQWEGGKHVRVYFQSQDGVLRELCKDDFDAEWVAGSFTAA
ncbi:fucose-specific lectin [Daedaleopsis nitida]|nr:fucose-specific lectin [Daedaleopsis nitida]